MRTTNDRTRRTASMVDHMVDRHIWAAGSTVDRHIWAAGTASIVDASIVDRHIWAAGHDMVEDMVDRDMVDRHIWAAGVTTR